MLSLSDYLRIYKARGFRRLFDEIRENWFYDKLRGTDTQLRKELDEYHLDKALLSDSVQYQPTYTSTINRSLKVAYKLAVHPCTFLDYGSGKGKIVLQAQRFDFEKIIGVEIDSTLNEVAQNNINILNKRFNSHPNVSLVTADAREFIPPDNTGVVFLFNPFGYSTLDIVIGKLEICAKRAGSSMIVIYVNTTHTTRFSEWKLVYSDNKYMHNTRIYQFDGKDSK